MHARSYTLVSTDTLVYRNASPPRLNGWPGGGAQRALRANTYQAFRSGKAASR
jgi:hypothetical protein